MNRGANKFFSSREDVAMNSKGYLPNGSIDARTMEPELRAMYETIIAEARKAGHKTIEQIVKEYDLPKSMITTLRGIEQKMDCDNKGIDFEHRVLCPDGICTGIIIDGKCSECGRIGEESALGKPVVKEMDRDKENNMVGVIKERPETNRESGFHSLSGWYRLFIIISIIWIIIVYITAEPWRGYSGPKEFFSLGILPVVVFWGVIWVTRGFRKNRKKKD